MVKAIKCVCVLFCFILGTNNYFKQVIAEFGIAASFVDCTNLSALEKAIQSNTKVNCHSLASCTFVHAEAITTG